MEPPTMDQVSMDDIRGYQQERINSSMQSVKVDEMEQEEAQGGVNSSVVSMPGAEALDDEERFTKSGDIRPEEQVLVTEDNLPSKQIFVTEANATPRHMQTSVNESPRQNKQLCKNQDVSPRQTLVLDTSFDGNERIENQFRNYNETLDLYIKITEDERKALINAAVDANWETPKEYKCQICLLTVYKPKDCQNCDVAIFCGPCIEHVLEHSKNPVCPNCQQNEGFRNINKRVLKYLEEYKVQCTRKDCPRKNGLQLYKDFVKYHPEECIRKSTRCPNECGEKVTPETRMSHLLECPKLLVSCGLCKAVHLREHDENHIQECPEVMVACKECDDQIKRKDLISHCQNQCKETVVQCEACNMCYKRKDKNQHDNVCEEGETTCEECLVTTLRKDWNQHNCFAEMRELISTLEKTNAQLRELNEHQRSERTKYSESKKKSKQEHANRNQDLLNHVRELKITNESLKHSNQELTQELGYANDRVEAMEQIQIKNLGELQRETLIKFSNNKKMLYFLLNNITKEYNDKTQKRLNIYLEDCLKQKQFKKSSGKFYYICLFCNESSSNYCFCNTPDCHNQKLGICADRCFPILEQIFQEITNTGTQDHEENIENSARRETPECQD